MIGIYKITNITNGKMYIGSSNNIDKRWKQHKALLRKGTHHSAKLQNSWNKHGEENFEFEVIEECDTERLLYLEQFYIDKYMVYFEGYNCRRNTREMMTEVDYERAKLYERCNKIIEPYVSDGTLIFMDKNALKRYNNCSYKNNEQQWYFDICVFVSCMYAMGSVYYIGIKNNPKPDEAGFIQFTYGDKKLTFLLIFKEINTILEFSYNIEERWIIFTGSYDLDNYAYVFDRRVRFDDTLSKDLLGYIYYTDSNPDSVQLSILVDENTDKYFAEFKELVNPLFSEDLYFYYFKNNHEFLLMLFEHHKRCGYEMSWLEKSCRKRSGLPDKYIY